MFIVGIFKIIMLLGLLASGALVIWYFTQKRTPINDNAAIRIRKKKTWMLIGVGIILAINIFANSFVVVEVGHATLVKRFGEPVAVLSPGPHFVVPVINTTTDYLTRNIQIDMDFGAYSFDAQNMDISATIQYEIDPQHIIDIATRFGKNSDLAARISRIAEEKIKTVLSAKSATKIIETRDQLGGELLKSVKAIEEEYYINVVVAVAHSITFSPEFQVAVENKMKAEQAKLQANYDKETAIIKAEQQLEVAIREAEAAIAKAHGDAEALAIMTKAWDSIGQAVKDAMIRQQFIEKWNGIMPQVVSDGNMIYDLGLGNSQ